MTSANVVATTVGDRVIGAWNELNPNRRRAIRHGLSLVGLISLPYIVVLNWMKSLLGFDAYAYWSVDLDHLYRQSLGNTSELGAFRYTPAFAELFAPFHALPWDVFLAMWLGAMFAALVWLTGRHWLLAMALPPVALELYHGNIHLFMALAIVLGFRWPATWAFVLLTKVSPGVGVLWFLFRGEWRKLAVAVAVTAGIAGVSFVIAPDLWRQYTQTMVDNLSYDPGHPYPVPIPLAVRIAAGAALIWWGARTDRRWTVPLAATLALPIIWFHGLAMLLAIVPLSRANARFGLGGDGSRHADSRARATVGIDGS